MRIRCLLDLRCLAHVAEDVAFVGLVVDYKRNIIEMTELKLLVR